MAVKLVECPELQDEKLKKKLVYISGPYKAPTIYEVWANIQLAKKYAEKYWKKGCYVFCPHLNSGFLDSVAPEAHFLESGLVFLRLCDVVVMLPNWRSSNGAAAERLLAVQLEKEIIYE